MATPLLRAEMLLFAGTIVTGAMLAVAYCLLCLFRHLVSMNKHLTGVTDVLFFVAAAFVAYTTIYRLGNGVIRYYAACGLVLGAAVIRSIVKCGEKRLQKRRYHRKMNNTEEVFDK